MLIILATLAVVAPGFYQAQPLLSLLTREAPSLIVACGMAWVIICRQIDISVGSQFGLCSVCAGLLAGMHWPIALVGICAMALGALLGWVNGFLVAGLRLPSIVVTLATMVTLREGLRWKRQGEFVTLPDTVQWFGFSQQQGQVTIIVVSLLVLIILAVTARHLSLARDIYAVGSDAEAARLAGIPALRITCFVFVLLGALTGLAAILNMAQAPQVDPKTGTGLELKAIAAVVVGGVSISGGRGSLWGVFLGLLLLACISPALTHLHVEAYWERAIHGGIILIAVAGDRFKQGKENS
ncbi:MAG: transporter permease [Verrucomicrobiales bacterium]|nr:transporter permease [Verrucomicrobiales bacterium]